MCEGTRREVVMSFVRDTKAQSENKEGRQAAILYIYLRAHNEIEETWWDLV